MRLLLVEDDENLGKATQEGLQEIYAVDWVCCAEDAKLALLTNEYNLIVLDISLPAMSGLELLKDLRKNKNQIAVLLLTARDSISSRIEGLNSGADDYLIKPFDLDELLARCAALIRRSIGQMDLVINCKDISYEPASGHLEKNGNTIMLSARERAVFDCLIRNIDRPISKDNIMQNIYDWSSEDVDSNVIEVYIASLRRKLGKEFIKTIRGVGYIIPK